MNTQSDADLSAILRVRDDVHHWDNHPIVCCKATLPTGPIGAAASLVISQARKQRESVAFWGHPVSGKSTCIRALSVLLEGRFPGCGIVVHEAKSNTVCAEGNFVKDILHSMDYDGAIQRDLADKRNQIRRALYAAGIGAFHIIFIVDEAQELVEKEFRWLKEQGNWLARKGFRVTHILFGQEELLDVRDMLISSGRSDLVERFFSITCEFERIKKASDLLSMLVACDTCSEYPAGSGWTYTQFLWPRAFGSGFRLASQAKIMLDCFVRSSPMTRGRHGISMKHVALALSELADLTKDRDAPHFVPSADDWMQAIALSGYVDRIPEIRDGRNGAKHQRTRGT